MRSNLNFVVQHGTYNVSTMKCINVEAYMSKVFKIRTKCNGHFNTHGHLENVSSL